MLCASWVAQTDLSEFFKEMESGCECLPAAGGREMSFRGRCEPVGVQHAGVAQSAKPEQGPETINKVTEILM